MIKSIIRKVLIFFHIDLTKNIKYDRLTEKILKSYVKPQSNCIDVGCHEGEILDIILRLAPQGQHFSFEPIPSYYDKLIKKYNNITTIYPYALSSINGKSKFHVVKNAPAYSGIKKRRYDIKNPDIEEIKVELKRLDDLIPKELKIDFVKIDVEGGEFDVLKGGKNLLKSSKPIIVIETGLGASDFYGTKPQDLYDFIHTELDMRISLLDSFLKGNNSLSKQSFENIFNKNLEFYFVIHP